MVWIERENPLIPKTCLETVKDSELLLVLLGHVGFQETVVQHFAFKLAEGRVGTGFLG